MLPISYHPRTQERIIGIGLLVVLLISLMSGSLPAAHAQEPYPVNPPAYVSADGLTLYNGVAPLVVVADPDPAMQNVHVADDPEVAAAINGISAQAATFSITYKAAGTSDPWGAACVTFPEAAKTAFAAAAAIWANTIRSAVPITISACWSNLGSPTILGYSGTLSSSRNFTGAPKTNVFYEASLANALHGSDLDPTYFDDYITYNSGFSWYYGTDGLPPAGQYDLVSVAAHEMAHGLNFSGTAQYASGVGKYGLSSPVSPNIYDTFVEDAAGTKLTAYTNPSTALGNLLRSGSLWFNGPNSKPANAGSRVKIYAPATWAGGSSYSHLDYSTFAGTANSMMVYAIGSGSSQHNPGPVTKAMLKDMGWPQPTVSTTPIPKSPAGTIADTTPTYKWTKIAGATQYRYQLVKGLTTVYTKAVLASAACTSTSTVCSNTPTNVLSAGSYKWRVQAMVKGAWKAYSAYKAFTLASGLPKAGLWQTTNTWHEFYVTPAHNNVDNFSVDISVTGCGSYTITHLPLVPISAKHFSFTGPFYASGTFSTASKATGQDGLSSFYISGCGTVSGGPWAYTAVWKNTTQPAIVARAVINLAQKLGLPDANLPSPYRIVKIAP